MSIRTKGHSLRRLRTSSQSENSSSFSLRRCSRMKPAGGRSSMRSFRTSSYVAPPTLYERRRAQVSLFTGIVVVGMTISIIKLIVLIVVARWCESGPLPDRRATLALVVRPDVPPRVAEREELRWILDGVGQPRADADREVAFSRARASIPRHSRKAREGATPVSTRPFVRCRMGCNSFEPVRLFGRAFSRQRVASPVPASAIRNDLNSPAEIQRDRRYISSQGSKRPPHFPCRRGESCRRQSSTIRCRRYPLVQNEKGKSGLGFSREFGHKEKPVSFKELSTPPMG